MVLMVILYVGLHSNASVKFKNIIWQELWAYILTAVKFKSYHSQPIKQCYLIVSLRSF